MQDVVGSIARRYIHVMKEQNETDSALGYVAPG
jgi:hypothetical protein